MLLALGGCLWALPAARAGEIQPTPVPVRPAPSNAEWKPPGVGKDGHDWLELKSGEWLRGWLRYVQDKRVDFDSLELEELTLKLKDVRTIYTAEPMYVKFERRQAVRGLVVVSNEAVFVEGTETLRLTRSDLIGITRSGITGIKYWSGTFTLGANIRSGNTESTRLNVRGALSRRTPGTDLGLIYQGSYAEADGVEDEHNQRVNALYDIRVSRHTFVRPLQAEYFRDPLANIDYRITGGMGIGYYLFDEDELVWNVAAGPGGQYKRFVTVEAGQDDSTSTLAAVLQSYFKVDVTRRTDLILSYQGFAVSQDAGRYSHLVVVGAAYEIKRHLDLDVSFAWDYLLDPRADSDGTIPARSDFRLTTGLGVRF